MRLLFFLLSILLIARTFGESCDHQTTTYNGDVVPTTQTGDITITPFFSPDNSVQVITELLDSAEKSIDIGTVHFKSWMKCGDSYHKGCEVDVMRNNDTAPYWPVLLNAIHRGVIVRIIANDCEKYPQPGLIDPLAFLSLTGAQVKYYTTTTFYHNKYICVDGKKVSLSSINLSKSSFTSNREAGILIENNSDAISLYQEIFENDFKAGGDWIVGQFNDSQMKIILDRSPIAVPGYPNTTTNCTTPLPISSPIHVSSANTLSFAMPDHAHETLNKTVSVATSTFDLYVYAINSMVECSIVSSLVEKGIKVRLLVSSFTIGDFHEADKCYHDLYNMGLRFRITQKYCLSFWHQKFWIVDGTDLFVSTGNWDEHDFPTQTIYPPKESPDNVVANRGMCFSISNSPNVVSVYSNVLDRDWNQGIEWTPT